MDSSAQIIPAYVDEAGPRGRVRDLSAARDAEVSLLCALVFDPRTHDQALARFSEPYQRFKDAAPIGGKLHATDAFAHDDLAWRAAATRTRTELFQLIEEERACIVYGARRLGRLRESHGV